MKVPFDVRSVTLQLKGDPKVQWGTQFAILKKLLPHRYYLNLFFTVPECPLSFFFFFF